MKKRDYLALLDELAGVIEQAFLDMVRERVKRISVKDVESGVLAQDVEAILEAAGLSRGDVTMLSEAIRSGYVRGAVIEALEVGMLFDVTNIKAEKWLREMSSRMVVEITERQRDAIKVVLEAGMRAGKNPRSVALDIVGRVAPSGKREGGIIGLHDTFASYVTNAREELANLDPHYLTRTRRDKRFDKMIERAIKNETPLTVDQIDAITGRYADRLLKTRGDTIGRTEALTSISSGREQAWQQAVGAGEVDPKYVTRVWSATMDNKTRASHKAMDGQEQPFNMPFEDGDGNRLMFPGDTSLEAPASSTIGCRCMLQIKVDYAAIARDRMVAA